jgi:NADPH:quinone reductase-like Zn-dependent oxidoreductase
VGTAAIQLAKLFGAKVAITAGNNDKLAYCQKLGADKAVSYKDGPW